MKKPAGNQGKMPPHGVSIKTGPPKQGPPHGTRGNPVSQKGGAGGSHGAGGHR